MTDSQFLTWNKFSKLQLPKTLTHYKYSQLQFQRSAQRERFTRITTQYTTHTNCIYIIIILYNYIYTSTADAYSTHTVLLDVFRQQRNLPIPGWSFSPAERPASVPFLLSLYRSFWGTAMSPSLSSMATCREI